MHFDTPSYRLSKDRIIDRIKATHDWERTEGFVADGVICPAVCETQPRRILCILAESYGYEGEGVTDIEDQAAHDILGLANPPVKTPRRLATFLYLLQRSFETGRQVTLAEWHEVPELFAVHPEHTAILQEVLSKIAWINVKKASNGDGTRLNRDECVSHALRNEAVLREQIQATMPHLVMVFGQAAFSALVRMSLLGPNIAHGRGWQIQDSGCGFRVIELSHPAYFHDWNTYSKVYQNYAAVFRQLDW